MGKKNMPRYKSSEYFGKFRVKWFDGNEWPYQKELINSLKDRGELTPESEVGIKYKYEYISSKGKEVYWERATRQGKEKVILGEIEPDEYFLYFLDKFFKKWHSGYRKTRYCIMRAICNLYQKNPEQFKEITNKAKTLQEFIILAGIR